MYPDSQAMDDGWAPDAETRARADAAAWNGRDAAEANKKSRRNRRTSAAAAAAEAAEKRRMQAAIVVADDDTRRRGLTIVWRLRFRRFWDVWCRAW